MVIVPRARGPACRWLRLSSLCEMSLKKKAANAVLLAVSSRKSSIGSEVADRLLANDEVVAHRLVQQDPAVEPVARLVDRDDLGAGPFLDQTLDHDEEVVGQRAGLQHGVALAEEYDVDDPG